MNSEVERFPPGVPGVINLAPEHFLPASRWGGEHIGKPDQGVTLGALPWRTLDLGQSGVDLLLNFFPIRESPVEQLRIRAGPHPRREPGRVVTNFRGRQRTDTSLSLNQDLPSDRRIDQGEQRRKRSGVPTIHPRKVALDWAGSPAPER